MVQATAADYDHHVDDSDRRSHLTTTCLANKGRPACKFYASGSCAAGDMCPFAHGTSPSTYDNCLFQVANNNDIHGEGLMIEPAADKPPSSALSSSALIGGDQPVIDNGGKKLSYSQLASMSPASALKPNCKTIITSQLNPSESYDRLPLSSSSASTLASNRELCVFAMTGKCRFGSFCRNVHGLQCPRCLLYCLHPTDLDQNEEHIMECLEKPIKLSNMADEEVECGICLERVLSKPDPRFGLLNCEHAFCLACIRQWRATASNASSDPTTVRSCPLCRTVTYFIVPSNQFINNEGDNKTKVIEAYKKKVQAIPCKHYDHGRGRCPFGGSCFYNHRMADGSQGPPDLPRSYVDANEQVKVIREFRLSDFLPPRS